MGKEIMPDASMATVQITGEWTSRLTGRTVHVMNTAVDENNNMVIITDAGDIGMQRFSDEYVQMSDEEVSQGQAATVRPEQAMPAGMEIPKGIPAHGRELPEDIMGEFETVTEITREPEAQPIDTIQEPARDTSRPECFNMLDKLFENTEAGPEIRVAMEWECFPHAETDMLKKYFGLTDELLSRYIYEKYITEESVSDAITGFLTGDDVGTK
jgi:hypothetical protein